MRYPDRVTMCVSSQAGCGMACPFCATGQGGLERNMSTAEIVEQVVAGARSLARGEVPGGPGRVSNVVFMGMGEPLANYRAVIGAVRRMTDPTPAGLGMSARGVTVSTVGLVPRMRQLAEEGIPVTLALSLHAPDDELRNELVPINTRGRWARRSSRLGLRPGTKRRVSIEYAMIAASTTRRGGPTCWPKCSTSYGDWGWVHVNLIPLNPTPGSKWTASDPADEREFVRRLEARGVPTTVRDTRGREIDGACGQLAATGREVGSAPSWPDRRAAASAWVWVTPERHRGGERGVPAVRMPECFGIGLELMRSTRSGRRGGGRRGARAGAGVRPAGGQLLGRAAQRPALDGVFRDRGGRARRDAGGARARPRRRHSRSRRAGRPRDALGHRPHHHARQPPGRRRRLGDSMPPDDEIAAEVERAETEAESGGGSVVAYLDGVPSAAAASRWSTAWPACGAAPSARRTAAGASTAPWLAARLGCTPSCATAPRWRWSRAGWRPRDRSCAALASAAHGQERSYRVRLSSRRRWLRRDGVPSETPEEVRGPVAGPRDGRCATSSTNGGYNRRREPRRRPRRRRGGRAVPWAALGPAT